MNSEQYNRTIIEFYANSFLHLSLKATSLKIDIHQKAKELTDNFSISFNNYIAKDFLNELKISNPTIQGQLENYPEQFWITITGREYFEAIQNEVTTKMTDSILSAINNNEKLDYNMLSSTLDNLITIYEQDLNSGKKQLLKIKKEMNNHKTLKNEHNLIHLLGESINKSKKTNTVLKNIKEDFELLI